MAKSGKKAEKPASGKAKSGKAKSGKAKSGKKAESGKPESGAKAESGDSVKHALVLATLAHVPFDGWSDAALRAAAADCAVDEPTLAAIFPKGAISAVEAFLDLADREMVAAFAALTGDAKPKGITASVREAILLRLDWATPHREAVASSVKLLAAPQHAPLAAKSLYRTCDAIWRLTGDAAVDFSFYTKRASLAAVYSATLLYWVSGKGGGDRAGVAAFLDKRLADLARIPKATAPVRKAAGAGARAVSEILRRMPQRKSG